MYDGFSLLALIPARAGSKGLPNKNIISCAGKPLIEWSISAAKNVSYIDDVVVSTNSNQIAEVACFAGASVPYLRPEELSTDESSILDVVSHTWKNHLDTQGKHFDYVVLLQPTSPLRTSENISNAIKTYFQSRQSDSDTLASVYQADQKNGWLMQLQDNTKYINFCFDINIKNPQRQKLKPYYLPNGAISIIKGSEALNGVYRNNTIPFVMNALESIDIDTADDLNAAEVALLEK